jgi:hypothetical protein
MAKNDMPRLHSCGISTIAPLRRHDCVDRLAVASVPTSSAPRWTSMAMRTRASFDPGRAPVATQSHELPAGIGDATTTEL